MTPAMDPRSPDALLPPAMAEKAEAVGVAKARLGTLQTLMLGVLAGAFIGLGAVFATTVVTGSTLSFGLTKLLAGLVFSLGLILVIVGGAELFTGNNLIVMAWAAGRIRTAELLRNWGLVYLGNLLGSLGLVALVFAAGHHLFAEGQVGLTALRVAEAKCELGFARALALGVLCNLLVCLAVWLSFSARTTTDRILAIVPPIAAFVAAGFEHSIANMYFIPMGLALKHGGSAEFWTSVGASPQDFASLTVQGFLVDNLLPVTLGNVLGGSLLVAGVYWIIYRRR
jgi:formate transporter